MPSFERTFNTVLRKVGNGPYLQGIVLDQDYWTKDKNMALRFASPEVAARTANHFRVMGVMPVPFRKVTPPLPGLGGPL